MAPDDLNLTPNEERAVAALGRTLRQDSSDDPLRLEVAAWIAGGPARRSLRPARRLPFAAALAAVLTVAAAAVAVPRLAGPPASPTAPSSSPTPVLPGAPGHFDNSAFSFDYPTSWPVISGAYNEGIAVQVYAVLGTGDWRSGCVLTANGGSCTGDTADVSGGRVVVKIWNVVTGPANICGAGTDQPNATAGPNAVMRETQGSATTWEIRMPGARFGWVGNMAIQAWADGPEALAQVEALVASFRWDQTATNGAYCLSPEASPSLAHYDSDGISFDYPSSWSVLSGKEDFGLEGPRVLFAVGTGEFDSGCVSPPASGPSVRGFLCNGPTTSATGDQVVVYWYEGTQALVGPLSSTSPPPGSVAISIDGHGAVETDWPGAIRWDIGAVDRVEARWGPDAGDAEAQVRALIDSLQSRYWPGSS
jgi:hypothetical protein